MGWDLPSPETAPTKPKSNGLRPNTQRGCDHCPMQKEWKNLKTPQMAMSGTPDADVLIIGEAPGEEEDKQGYPFVGPAGQVLQKTLQRVLRQESRIAMTNTIRCRPPKNRDPAATEVHACSIHLEEDIAKRNIKAILGLGGAALSRFLTGAGITQIHGLKFPIEIAGKVLWYYPTFHPSYILHTGESRGSYEASPALPVFENDIARFFAEVDSWPKPVIEEPDPNEVVCAYTEEEAHYWLDQIDWTTIGPDNPIGLDIETNGLRPNIRGALIMSAAVSDGELAIAWPISHQQGANNWGLPLLLTIAQHNRWVAHNAGFELAWLYEHAKQNGIQWEPEQGFDDSMAAARLYQRRETALNLGILTRLYTGTNIKSLSTVSTERISKEPLPDVLKYNGLDSWGCWRIFNELGPKIPRRSNYESILSTIASVTAMQLTGLDIDQDAVFKLREEWQGRANAAVAHARTIPEVVRYREETQREFNIGSAEQVGEILVTYGKVPLPRTRDGSYSTTDQTLTALAPDHPLVLDTLLHRHATKMCRVYLDPLVKAPSDYIDHKVHPVYSTMLTRTFRLSSEDPNIQNFPKRKDRELRRPIVPPKGCVFLSADFGALEARVYAMASKDPELIRSTIAKVDIHSYWMNRVLELYPPYRERLIHLTESTDPKRHRDVIKSDIVFNSLYGGGARQVAERTGIPYDLVLQILGQFWELYSGAAEWLRAQRKQYRDTGMTRDLFGRERYGTMTNEVINHCMQASASRLVLDAQNELYQLSRQVGDPYLSARLQIHDDITLALPDDDDLIEAYIDGISEILTRVRYDFQCVPLMVEWRLGKNWSDMEPVYEFTGDYVR